MQPRDCRSLCTPEGEKRTPEMKVIVRGKLRGYAPALTEAARPHVRTRYGQVFTILVRLRSPVYSTPEVH